MPTIREELANPDVVYDALKSIAETIVCTVEEQAIAQLRAAASHEVNVLLVTRHLLEVRSEAQNQLMDEVKARLARDEEHEELPLAAEPDGVLEDPNL